MTEAEDVVPASRWILHFTHVENLPNIIATGRLMCDVSAREGVNSCEVGDPDVKELRRNRVVPIPPGGHGGDYVPFYFAPRSPMPYRIACDHRDGIAGRYLGGDRPLVHLATTVGAVVNAGLPWVATDGNAATATTEFSSNLSRLDTMVDWPLMSAQYWHNIQADPDRQRRRMAEFLVHADVPIGLIKYVGTYSEPHANAVRAALGDLAVQIAVRPTWYYG